MTPVTLPKLAVEIMIIIQWLRSMNVNKISAKQVG